MKNLNEEAFLKIQKILKDDEAEIIVIKGPAGSGKTTLIKHLLEWINSEEIGTAELMASTGRAAKILSNKTNYPATTVHNKIYEFVGLDGDDDALDYDGKGKMKDKESRLIFTLSSNDTQQAGSIYIIDEASMISDMNMSSVSFSVFGSGRLLKDLLEFCSKGKIIFVGDEYQLPPISEESISPALDKNYLSDVFKKKVAQVKLKKIHRFDSSGFIFQVTSFYRNRIDKKGYNADINPLHLNDCFLYPNFSKFFNGYLDIIRNQNYEKAIFITPSNNMAMKINMATRDWLYPDQGKVHPGEILIVTQNSYPFHLYNGDLVVVLSISKRIASSSGLQFLQLRVRELFSGSEKEILLIEDLLYDGKANLDSKQHQKLIIEFTIKCKRNGVKPKSEQYYMLMMQDSFLNAVRAKFGYAITCHKAQGGEWENVFVRLFPFIEKWPHPKGDQWKYTALTRASSKLHLIQGSLNVTIKTPF